MVDIFKKGTPGYSRMLDMQVVKTQLANDNAATDATMSKLKGAVECADDIAEMKTTNECLPASAAELGNK